MKPLFIQQAGDPQIPPPYVFKDVSIKSFRLPADGRALVALCDRMLNIGDDKARGFSYRPMLPFVDLEVLTYGRMESQAKGFDMLGHSKQHELLFRLLVVKWEEVLGIGLPTEIAIFVPYIFVDNTWSVTTGREVIGYPKLLASFELPSTDPYPISVSTDVLAKYGRSTKQERKPLIDIKGKSGKLPDLKAFAFSMWPCGALNLASLGLATLHPLLSNLSQPLFRVPIVQLKQIRDAENPAHACYQALVHADFEVERIGEAVPLPPAEITIHEYDSLRVTEILGLQEFSVRPTWQYSLTCDLRLGNVKNLYVVS
jgi:hypothetical protein